MAALVTLIFVAIWMSFRTPGSPGDPISYGVGAFPELYGDTFFHKTMVNTAIFALVTVGTSLFFGTALGWLVERTNLRFKEFMRTLVVFGLLIPGFLSAMGWVLLLDDRIGVINTAIQGIPGFDWFSIDIAHPAGMVCIV
jgi:iron(III) transport system permease protein